jgi:hypothetical protein
MRDVACLYVELPALTDHFLCNIPRLFRLAESVSCCTNSTSLSVVIAAVKILEELIRIQNLELHLLVNVLSAFNSTPLVTLTCEDQSLS